MSKLLQFKSWLFSHCKNDDMRMKALIKYRVSVVSLWLEPYFWPAELLFLSTFTLFGHSLSLDQSDTKCQSVKALLLHVWVGVWLLASIPISANLISAAHVYIMRCRKAKNLDYMAKQELSTNKTLNQPAIMWLNITLCCLTCFPMWLWEENIPFEGQFKITGQADGAGHLWIIWIAEIGFKQLMEYLENWGGNVTGQTAFPLQLQVQHSWNNSCFSRHSQPSYTQWVFIHRAAKGYQTAKPCYSEHSLWV